MKRLSSLLSKMASFMSVLLTSKSEQTGLSENFLSEGLEPPSIQQLAASEVGQTFIRNMDLCLRHLREAAKNEQLTTEKELETAEIERQTAEFQKVLKIKTDLPHRVYGTFLKHDGLEWVATFGQDENGQPFLVGRGNTPKDALYDFDAQWLGSK